LSGYKELVPEVWQPGTPEREKVEREFNHLVGLGDPRSEATEAKALRAAFGDLSTLRASRSARPGPADTHSETGGGKPAGGGNSDAVLKDLSQRQKEHYQRGIDQGRYKDWDEVKAEIKEASPRRSAR
jgi:hypothetical protein